MLQIMNVSSTYGMPVFTDDGKKFGIIEEAILEDNKVFGWRVVSSKNSVLAKSLGGAKGVIVPHQLIKAVGDIIIMSRAAIPSGAEQTDVEEEITE